MNMEPLADPHIALARTQCDLIVHSATILTVDAQNRIVADGALAITNGRIAAIGSTAELRQFFDAAHIIDAGGGVIHPGFIDAHVHVSQYTARSVLPRMASSGITMGHWKGALTPEDEHASALLAASDYLACGYTGFVDPGTVFEPDAVAAVATEAGIRIWLADPYVADRLETLRGHMPELISESFLARWPSSTSEALNRLGSQLFRNNEEGLVRGYIALYGIGTDSPELFREAVACARSAGVQFQEHLAYIPAAHVAQEAEWGGALLGLWSAQGLLGPDISFVHMNLVRSSEVALIAGNGARVVCCPYGSMQMIGQEHVELRQMEMHRAGIFVGLGSDIPRIVEFDGLGSLMMSMAAAINQPAQATEILRMRTIGAAATIGADADVGSLEAGKRADFVVRRAGASTNFGLDHAHENGVLGSRQTVSMVFVGGVQVVREGSPILVDCEQITHEAHGSAKAIADRIGL